MNPFLTAILNDASIKIENITFRLDLSDTALSTFYWFNAYKSVEFPEVVCDKEYFFLYSTDHDAGAGGVYWGKGNDINLSDFIEVGLITSGYQSETPRLLRVPSDECGDNEVLHLFFHRTTSEPGNDSKQQTRLLTSSGEAQLHQMTWTDKGRPLGIVGNENHTGYFYPYRRGFQDYIGFHITMGGLPQPWFNSTSINGRDWIRGNEIDTTTGILNEYFAQPSLGVYFEKYGRQWWIGQLHPTELGALNGVNSLRKIALCKSVNYSQLEEIKLLDDADDTGNHSVKIIGDSAFVYIVKGGNELYTGTYDLTDLQNYI